MPTLTTEDVNFSDSDNDNAAPAEEPVVEDAVVASYKTPPDADTVRIMLSTDNHLGYLESDEIRGMDSFAAFEEVLYLAKNLYHCDLVLLAGDLFHDNRPTRRTLYKTLQILRHYCLGPKAVKLQFVNDARRVLRNTDTVNYQNPHMTVDLPIFSIHGNHDDPSRESGELLAALDLLSVTHLVNYFGRQEQVDAIQVEPVMLRKGETNIALYGLGSMREERLHRMWKAGKVKFMRPKPRQNGGAAMARNDDSDESDEEASQEEDDYFNIFALHQNRDLGRGSKNCVNETMIPDWMDVIVWGHEHECLIDFQESVVGTFRITQPGSSVATSLVAGESVRKNVGILDVRGRDFRLLKVPLTQVRPFVTSEIMLAHYKDELDPDDTQIEEKLQEFLEEQVQVLCLTAKEQRVESVREARKAGNTVDASQLKFSAIKQEKMLVRIRVEHSGFSSLGAQRFGAKFVGQVANPMDLLLFFRRKNSGAGNTAASKRRKAIQQQPLAPEELERVNMEDIVRECLGAAPDQALKLLSEPDMSYSMNKYVDKNNSGNVISDIVDNDLLEKQRALIEGKNSQSQDSGGTNKVSKVSEVRQAIEDSARTRAAATNTENADSQPEAEDQAADTSSVTASRKPSRTAAAKSRTRQADYDSDMSDVIIEDDNTKMDDVAIDVSTSRSTRGRKPASQSLRPAESKSQSTLGSRSAASRKRLQVLKDFGDEDEDDDIISTGLGSKAAAKSERVAKPAPRAKRATAKASYYTADSDDDIVDVDSDNDKSKPMPSTKKRKAVASQQSTREKPTEKGQSQLSQWLSGTNDEPAPSKSRKPKAAAAAATGNQWMKGKKTETKKSRNRISRAELSDSDVDASSLDDSIDLSNNWGTAATRSQF